MAQLNLSFLGPFQASLDGEPIVAFESNKVRALLAYLAVELDRPHPRETLAGLLWPDWPDRAALRNLSYALSDLRKVTGDRQVEPPFLLISREAIQFNPQGEHWLDVEVFQAQVETGADQIAQVERLTQAVSLYRGRFLDGFFLDDSPPFEEWVLLKREALTQQMFAMLRWLADWHEQFGEYKQAQDFCRRQIEIEPWNEETHQQLMRLLAFDGQRSSALAQYETCRRLLTKELGIEPGRDTLALFEAIRDERLEKPVVPPLEEPPAAGAPPYKGLQYFDAQDVDLFFGRELLTVQLVARLWELLRRPASSANVGGPRFLAVVGASGSGKSSLVRAGLVPTLRGEKKLFDGALPPTGCQSWPIYLITPAEHPFISLATALTGQPETHPETSALVNELRHDSEGLPQYLNAARKQSSGRWLLLIVDQFEELFTACKDEAERQAFIDNLLYAAESDSSCLVLITLRADFYAHCARYPHLRQLLSARQEYIGAMDETELRRVIEEPARVGGWEIEPGLVDLILRDVGEEPGTLPLLSHALLATWERRRGRTLTLKGYAEAGGVNGAIARTAEALFTRLLPEEQTVVRRIFLRLTELGEGTQDTRRRASFMELGSTASETSLVESVLEKLAGARLVTLTVDSAEVAHEALIREWPALREWLNEDREGLRLHHHLIEAAQAWEALGRDPGELYRGSRLDQAREWAQRPENFATLNALEQEFLSASQEFADQEVRDREARRQRELEAAQALAQAQAKRAEVEQRHAEEQARSAARLRRRALYLALALCVAVILGGIAMLFGRQAGITANNNATLAAESALSAQFAHTQEAQARAASTQVVAESERRATQEQIAIQQAQQRATAEAFALSQRDLASQQALLSQVRELSLAARNNLEIDPQLSLLLAVQAAELALSGEIEMPPEVPDALHQALQLARARLVLKGHTGQVWDVAFSPDGGRLATAGMDGKVIVWNAADGRVLFTLGGEAGEVNTVVFHPDGIRLASGGTDGNVRIWDTNTGQLTGVFPAHAAAVTRLAFSPDGNLLASASQDESVKLWNLTGNAPVLTLTGHTGEIWGVAFGPVGNRLATASIDGTIRIWDGLTGKELQQLSVSEAEFQDVAFSPDGMRLAGAYGDGQVAIWDVASGEVIKTLSGHQLFVKRLSFSPDGLFLATGSQDGAAKTWDVDSGETLLTFASHAGVVNGLAYSPECVEPPQSTFAWCGPRLAVANRDGSVTLYDVTPAGGQEVLTVPGMAGYFTPDSQGLQTIQLGKRGTLLWQTWNLAPGSVGERLAAVTLAGFSGPVIAGESAPDRNRLLTLEADGTLRIWDAGTGDELKRLTLTGHTDWIAKMRLNPDGSRLATASKDGTAQIWDITNGEELLTLIHPAVVVGLAFSPDGERLATGDEAGNIHIWDALTGQEIITLAGHNLPVNTVEFSPDGKRLASTGMDTTVRLWDVASGKELLRLTGHTSTVTQLAFSPDGQRLASGGYGEVVKIWDISAQPSIQRELLSLSSPGWVYNLAFSPDGKRLARGSYFAGTVRIYALEVDELVALAKARRIRPLTAQECQKYLHLEKCPENPPISP